MGKNGIPRYFAVFLAGLLISVYPVLSQAVHRSFVEYEKLILNQNLTEREITGHRVRAEGYNSALKQGTQKEYEKILDLSDGAMGVICIPRIGVELPIYHGTGEIALSKGAGHLPETAFPIGGEGNHAVITAHTGYPGARMFSDLILLVPGDIFEIHILKDVLEYRVDQILVVQPEETEALSPVEGKDYCTLVTCTPYGINSHRLLVRGVRISRWE